MSATATIPPIADANLFSDGDATSFSSSSGSNDEFQNLMARALWPTIGKNNATERSSEPPPPASKFARSAEWKTENPDLHTAGFSASKDKSSSPAKRGERKHENPARNLIAQIEAAFDTDNPQTVPIHILAPTLSACLVKTVSSATSQGSKMDSKVSTAEAKTSANGKIIQIGPAVSEMKVGAPVNGKDSIKNLFHLLTRAETAISKEFPATIPGAKDDSSATQPAISIAALKTSKVPDEPAVHLQQTEIPEATDFAKAIISPKQSEIRGTAVAQQETQVKKSENTIKVAGQNEKVLPGKAISAAFMKNFSPRENFSAPALPRFEQTASIPAVAAGSSVNSPKADFTNSTDSISAASAADLRSRSLERANDMITLHSMRLRDASADLLHVVIKPGAGTQLSLELRQRGDVIEAQAILQRGDFEHLNQQWPELQQRLEQRGIKLAPLNDESFNGGNNFFQQKQNQPGEQNSFAASAFAELALAGSITEPMARQAALAIAHRGWESWA